MTGSSAARLNRESVSNGGVNQRFSGKVALVTGAGSGRATVLLLAKEGAAVVVVDIDSGQAESVSEEIGATGSASLALGVDVTDAVACARMVETAVGKFGHLDIVVPNAGINAGALVADMSTRTWNDVISVNLTGVFNTRKAAIPALTTAGGAIVTIGSSMAGWDASAGGAAYMASKERVTGLTKSLALQLGRYLSGSTRSVRESSAPNWGENPG